MAAIGAGGMRRLGQQLAALGRVRVSARSRDKCTASAAVVGGIVAGIDMDDDLLLDAVEAVEFDVLARLGDDPDARYEFFKPFVALAREAGGWPGRLT